ncbi:MAG: hypothetical protein NC930_05540 [Candidatus Omnitrophica bacterium]|nr:hypothetical protein [Candidatus Omnitrophota bacterium]
MDKKTLYEKAEKAFNQAFEVTKQTVKAVSEKAGETAHITKLLIDKLTLEHQVTRQFAKLGGRIYEKSTREGKKISDSDREIKALIEEAKKLAVKLAQVEATLEQERRVKNKK